MRLKRHYGKSRPKAIEAGRIAFNQEEEQAPLFHGEWDLRDK